MELVAKTLQYYLPWKLTEAQELTRKEQILKTTDTIVKEKEQFRRQKGEKLKELGVKLDAPDTAEDAHRRAPDHEPLSVTSKAIPDQASHEETNHEKDHDDAGYVMVEGEEDTVIY